METLGRIAKGIFIGAVLNGIAWFLLGIVDVLYAKNKFELFVPITAGFFGFVIGGIIGLFQLEFKIVIITTIAVATIINHWC